MINPCARPDHLFVADWDTDARDGWELLPGHEYRSLLPEDAALPAPSPVGWFNYAGRVDQDAFFTDQAGRFYRVPASQLPAVFYFHPAGQHTADLPGEPANQESVHPAEVPPNGPPPAAVSGPPAALLHPSETEPDTSGVILN